MADKEKEPKEEAVEAGEKKKSGNMLLIIIIVVLVLILVIGGVVVAMMSGNSEAEVADGAKKEASAHGDGKEEAAKEAHVADGEHSAEGGTEIGLMFPLETFTVNLLSESGKRYLKVDMTLEMEGEELSPELEEKKPVFRDIIIRQLTSKSLEEISTTQGKEKLKDGIITDLNKRLKDGKIKNIYFTSFVVQ
ncbi:MAG: flagellar basal body-associated protein FliL [Sulfurimonas sp.]|jgi:flagellar FliL protein